VRKLDKKTLKWGNEKLLSAQKEQTGSVPQSFVGANSNRIRQE
jgi:hypothetical protein